MIEEELNKLSARRIISPQNISEGKNIEHYNKLFNIIFDITYLPINPMASDENKVVPQNILLGARGQSPIQIMDKPNDDGITDRLVDYVCNMGKFLFCSSDFYSNKPREGISIWGANLNPSVKSDAYASSLGRIVRAVSVWSFRGPKISFEIDDSNTGVRDSRGVEYDTDKLGKIIKESSFMDQKTISVAIARITKELTTGHLTDCHILWLINCIVNCILLYMLELSEGNVVSDSNVQQFKIRKPLFNDGHITEVTTPDGSPAKLDMYTSYKHIEITMLFGPGTLCPVNTSPGDFYSNPGQQVSLAQLTREQVWYMRWMLGHKATVRDIGGLLEALSEFDMVPLTYDFHFGGGVAPYVISSTNAMAALSQFVDNMQLGQQFLDAINIVEQTLMWPVPESAEGYNCYCLSHIIPVKKPSSLRSIVVGMGMFKFTDLGRINDALRINVENIIISSMAVTYSYGLGLEMLLADVGGVESNSSFKDILADIRHAVLQISAYNPWISRLSDIAANRIMGLSYYCAICHAAEFAFVEKQDDYYLCRRSMYPVLLNNLDERKRPWFRTVIHRCDDEINDIVKKCNALGVGYAFDDREGVNQVRNDWFVHNQGGSKLHNNTVINYARGSDSRFFVNMKDAFHWVSHGALAGRLISTWEKLKYLRPVNEVVAGKDNVLDANSIIPVAYILRMARTKIAGTYKLEDEFDSEISSILWVSYLSYGVFDVGRLSGSFKITGYKITSDMIANESSFRTTILAAIANKDKLSIDLGFSGNDFLSVNARRYVDLSANMMSKRTYGWANKRPSKLMSAIAGKGANSNDVYYKAPSLIGPAGAPITSTDSGINDAVIRNVQYISEIANNLQGARDVGNALVWGEEDEIRLPPEGENTNVEQNMTSTIQHLPVTNDETVMNMSTNNNITTSKQSTSTMSRGRIKARSVDENVVEPAGSNHRLSRSVESLAFRPDTVVAEVDRNRLMQTYRNTERIVQGDEEGRVGYVPNYYMAVPQDVRDKYSQEYPNIKVPNKLDVIGASTVNYLKPTCINKDTLEYKDKVGNTVYVKRDTHEGVPKEVLSKIWLDTMGIKLQEGYEVYIDDNNVAGVHDSKGNRAVGRSSDADIIAFI